MASEPMGHWFARIETLVGALRELADVHNHDSGGGWYPQTPMARKYPSSHDLARQALKDAGFDLVAPEEPS